MTEILAIFQNPELALQEHTAHDTLVAALESLGPAIKVAPHAYNAPAAFEAEFGSGGRVLTFNAEYDALPDVGHACGHNLIATTSLWAFLAVAEALQESKLPGRVRLLGTPAEETIGGKITLIKAGAYKDADACLMVHPTSSSHFPDHILGDAFDKTLAITTSSVTRRCWRMALLRQHVRPEERIHVIIPEGGIATNVIPEKVMLAFTVRAPMLARAEVLDQRIVSCCKGAAEATGCELDITRRDAGAYADLRTNVAICGAFQDAIKGLGLETQNNVGRETTPVSTDQGNVSHECPSWHGAFGISSEGANPHTVGFEKAAGTRSSFDRALLACEGMAIAAYRFLTDDELAEEVRKEFEASRTP
ncbi:uncharacterized protein BDZ99DRAFT_507478 [Mytilinidion resinicola]|uniref:Peptidase M20 domain-containing protein 2 n=1 Tax=Mytilinidion resinicola TaxID=574789 RepID=A0A6A6YYG1_9PEZI|nr:uncharacterized protein BDZ99DRAFT_507478 [Mytilinidion resinicola]KAF2813588.1 hypothetical protein BDZ99DRAFT_507478 [Mytilinidion resinicola]